MSELRRRNVLRMVVLYVVAAWLILQVAEVIVGLTKLPEWIGPAILGLLAIGFPIALILSWFYELTPEGISLEKDVDTAESIAHITGRRLDFLVISLLSAGLILFAYDKWWMPAPPEQSIAVLAFENMSADPGQEYFSDGISEELLNLLAQIKPLKVIARTSSFSFKGQNVDIATVAKKLNVRHVLEGSVRRSGNRVRIAVQLIDAADSTPVWSETYDREFDDVFAVQDEIAAAISAALKVKLVLTSGKALQPTAIKAANTSAYDAYLQGRELFRRRGQRNVRDAISLFARSLRLDNNFAPAHAQLAIATTMLGAYRESTLEEVRRIAIPHLDRAQQLEPDLAEAYAGRALLAGLVGDPESEVEYARKALASNPSYVDAMNWLYIALNAVGHYEEAVASLKQMLVIDPLNPVGNSNYAEWLSQNGRVEEAHGIADQLLVQHSGGGYQSHASTSLISEGKIAEGLSWALRGSVAGDFNTGFALMLVGEYDEAQRLSDVVTHWVDTLAGRFDIAVRVAQRRLQHAPQNALAVWTAAEILYTAGRVDEALPLYERMRDFVPEGQPIKSIVPAYRSSNETMLRLALARRKAGDEDGAQDAVRIAKQDYAARRAAGRKDQFRYRTEAMIAAFEHDPDGVIAALESAVKRGLRDPQFFDDAIFENLRDEPRFVALRQELDAILAEEHEKVLQLICFNNPVPDNWRPLPETCEGVAEQRVL